MMAGIVARRAYPLRSGMRSSREHVIPPGQKTICLSKRSASLQSERDVQRPTAFDIVAADFAVSRIDSSAKRPENQPVASKSEMALSDSNAWTGGPGALCAFEPAAAIPFRTHSRSKKERCWLGSIAVRWMGGTDSARPQGWSRAGRASFGFRYPGWFLCVLRRL